MPRGWPQLATPLDRAAVTRGTEGSFLVLYIGPNDAMAATRLGDTVFFMLVKVSPS